MIANAKTASRMKNYSEELGRETLKDRKELVSKLHNRIAPLHGNCFRYLEIIYEKSVLKFKRYSDSDFANFLR